MIEIEDIKAMVEKSWSKGPKDSMYIATGRGGAINYHELILGRELTEVEKAEFKDGVYEFDGGFLTYKGEYK